MRLRRARDRMDRDYAEPLDVPALAAEALMSVGHFHRSFREAYGETPYAHLMTRRVERAAWLLRQGELSVTDVCMQVGCTSLGSFSARFTELMGESPSDYRALNEPSEVQPTSMQTSVTDSSPCRSSHAARSTRRVIRCAYGVSP